MVGRAAEHGYAYYAITDHAPNLYMQRMTDEKMLAQREQIAKLRTKHPKMTLLHGTELNIDPDGGVDWEAGLPRGIRPHRRVRPLPFHPVSRRDDRARSSARSRTRTSTSSVISRRGRSAKRPPVDLDLDAVFEAAARTGTALEINSHPDRLDLSDEHVLWARRHGVRFAVNTDAHAVPHLDHAATAIGTAQRGWLTKDDVINAWPLRKLQRFLAEGRP